MPPLPFSAKHALRSSRGYCWQYANVEGDMIDANDLAGGFARNTYVAKAQAEGLTHEDSLIRQPNGNCLNWCSATSSSAATSFSTC
jgi:hypothetical protein